MGQMIAHDGRYAQVLLESCASALVSSSTATFEAARAALHDAAIGLAAARGAPSAAERAELATLRRFREGIVSLRAELTACSDLNLVKETIDALIEMSFPMKMERK